MVLGASDMGAAQYSRQGSAALTRLSSPDRSAPAKRAAVVLKDVSMPQEPKGESFAALFEGDASRTPLRRSFKVGEELDVVVVQIGRDAVFVELDGKQEGFIEAKDLTNKSGELTVKDGLARSPRASSRWVVAPGAVRLRPGPRSPAGFRRARRRSRSPWRVPRRSRRGHGGRDGAGHRGLDRTLRRVLAAREPARRPASAPCAVSFPRRSSAFRAAPICTSSFRSASSSKPR